MVLESLEKSRVNIKALSIPEPTRSTGVLFNPETDLNELTWAKLTARAENMRKGDAHFFYSLVTTIKLVSLAHLNSALVDNQLRESMKSSFQVIHSPSIGALVNWSEAIERAFQFTTLFPDNFRDIYRFPIDWEEDYQKMASFVKRHQDRPDNFWLATMLGVISTKRLAKTKEIRHKMMPSAIGMMRDQKRKVSWENFIQAGVFLRVLFPEEFSKIKFGTFEWEGMKMQLNQELARGDIKLLLPLSILGASEIVIENHTIRLINDLPRTKLQEEPSLPQVRKF